MDKSKLTLLAGEDPLSLADQISGHRVFEWMAKNSVNILFAALLFFAIIFFIYRMSAGDRIKAENDYFAAAKDFNAFAAPEADKRSPLSREEAFKGLEEVLKRRPDLRQKYDALIAETFIARGEVEAALPFAKSSFKRTKGDNLPLYRDFANNTLLIAEGKLKEALSNSGELARKIAESGEKAEMAILYTYNLLREAMLQQKMGNREAELAAWQQLDNTLYTAEAMLSEGGNETRAIFEGLFTDGDVSLKNYLDYREKVLRSEKK